MKNFYLLFSCGILCILLNTCRQPSQGPAVINLDERDKTESVKFSQLASNLKCIPLESKENVIIPDNRTRKIWAGEKYIVTISNKDIQLFTANGKHLRKLASVGKGPQEFTYVLSYAVDEKHDRLYYVNQADRNHITVLDLNTGEHLPKIKIHALPLMMDFQDENILYIPANQGNSQPILCYTITTGGQLLDSVPNPHTTLLNNFITGRPTLIPVKQNEIHLEMQDTLYALRNSGVDPLFVFHYGNKFQPETNGQGPSKMLLAETSGHFLIVTLNVDLRKAGDNLFFTMRSSDILWVDKKDRQVQKVDQFYLDPLDTYKDDITEHLIIQNKKVIYMLSAFLIKEMAEKKTEAGEPLSPLLQQLNEQLTEESNPVLIIGDLN